MSQIHDAQVHDAEIPACPNCGQVDRVQGVPAVYRVGIDRVSVHVPSSGDEPAHTEQRTVTSALSNALAPEPPSGRYAWGCLGVPLVIGGIGAYIGAVAAGHWRETQIVTGDCVPDGTGFGQTCSQAAWQGPSYVPHGTYGWLGWLALLAFAAGVALVVTAGVKARGFRRRLARGREGAATLWSRAWYCARCGTAHFRPAADAPPGALQLGELRRLVWGAGGFGDLVARYPVV